MPKNKNLINKLMGAQQAVSAEDDEEEMVAETGGEEGEPEQDEQTGVSAESSEDWLSEYEGQLTIDMYQTKDNVVIKSTIAGVRPEDVDVTIANDMVTIRGERKRDFEASSEDYFYQECYWGSFSRSVVLPVDVDIENVGADLKDGILTVILPKAAKAKAKKIKVKGLNT
ncbi:MAG: Hsp20/alpha crystallin family protein [Candidatus Doudnabacteria bacterium]|nr:Hsp20/alpha crystallin family protein [Candidatus Doudnabacteria bacterium]